VIYIMLFVAEKWSTQCGCSTNLFHVQYQVKHHYSRTLFVIDRVLHACEDCYFLFRV